ncbi:MAG TPA: histidinol dehydrogenase [Spirochaetota bacterium]|nr:histidinol dehydrogenase [Spirochaetota bacterium]
MIQIERLSDLTKGDLYKLFQRFGADFTSIMVNTVIPIVQRVREEGEKAVLAFTKQFDGVALSSVYATIEEIAQSYEKTDTNVIDSFKKAIDNIKEFHLHQKRDSFL